MSLLTNLISYWKLDGNANDSHGSNNGTVSGATATTGKINQGYSFTNDSTDRIDLNDTLIPTDNFTISLWIKFTDKDSITNFNILSQFIANTTGRFAIQYGVSGLRFWCTTVIYDYTTTMNLNQWYFITLVKSNTYKTYIDGDLKNTSINTNSPLQTTNTKLGCIDSAFKSIGGSMDEVGIWSRALTAREVSRLYNGGYGLTYPFTGRSIFTGGGL